MSAALVRADAVAIPLADDSVDLIVTSPPYFALRSYQDGGEHYDGQIGSEPTPQAFLEALWAVTAECVRVLKPSGSLFVNLGDKYAGSGGGNQGGLLAGTKADAVIDQRNERLNVMGAPLSYNKTTIGGARPKSLMGLPWRYAIGCIDQLGLILRAEIIWAKPNGLPESVTDRVRRSHEQWFHLTAEPRYFAGVDEIREPQTGPPIEHYGRVTVEGSRGDGVGRDRPHGSLAQPGVIRDYNPLGKLPGSVWEGLDCDPWEQLLLSGPPAFCPRCGRDLAAGNTRASIRLPATASSPSRESGNGSPIGSVTSSSSDPSPMGSPSTTSAETPDAFDPTTSSPSPSKRTSGEAASPSKPIASTGTVSTTPTSTGEPGVTSPASAAHATRPACVCETLALPLSGPSSVWTVPSEPLRVPDWLGVDHFAAFPQELVRRLILGWSPSGVCVECGQGRRPVVDVRYSAVPESINSNNAGTTHRSVVGPRGSAAATITGYSCACPTLDAPTRPAVVLDPFAGTGTVPMVARTLGRYGIGLDLSADYLRLARWRVFDSGHGAKSRARTDRENQGALAL